MKTILGFLKPYRRKMLASMLMVAVSTFCDLLLPTIMSEVLTQGVYARNFAYIVRCCAAMVLTALIGLGAVLIGSKMSNEVVAGFCADLRSAVFRKVHTLSFEQVGEMGTAALITRATHDVDTIAWIAAVLSGTLVTVFVLFFGGVALTMRKDVILALTLLAFVPLILAAVVFAGKRIRPFWELSDEKIDGENAMLRERLRGIRVIRAFNAEPQEHRRLTDTIGSMSTVLVRTNIVEGLLMPGITLLLNVATILIVYLGGWRIETGSRLSGGDVFAVVQYISLIANGVLMGAFAIIGLPRATVAMGRIGEVLHVPPVQTADTVLPELTGDIVLSHVTFSYPGASAPALSDVSLHIRPGQRVAIIGGTGAGKSTLVNLLMGFRVPSQGKVCFDGHATDAISRSALRERISAVMQNCAVYSGTLRENVAMGRPDASDDAIREALAVAQAEFVERFADGLEHAVRQSGKNLSGGQKQRVAIARAVLKEADVYLFDDSFSALDFLTEAKLRAALAQKIAGKTQITVTQRVTSAMHCDVIFVLSAGRLAGAGTHAELLESCPVYRELYDSQTGGDFYGE